MDRSTRTLTPRRAPWKLYQNHPKPHSVSISRMTPRSNTRGLTSWITNNYSKYQHGKKAGWGWRWEVRYQKQHQWSGWVFDVGVVVLLVWLWIMNEFESQIIVLSNLIARICIILPFRFITPIGCSTQHCSQLATCLWFEAQTKAVWMQFQSFRCLASRRMLSKCSRHQQGKKYENIWKMTKHQIYKTIYQNITV